MKPIEYLSPTGVLCPSCRMLYKIPGSKFQCVEETSVEEDRHSFENPCLLEDWKKCKYR